MRAWTLVACVALAGASLSGPAEGQSLAGDDPSATSAEIQPAPPPPAAPGYDEDLDHDPAEPDFQVITLRTNLRLPRHKLAFRLTHRFARGLGEGSLSDLAADGFGLDGGALAGYGLRFGLLGGTSLGVYRTSDRTIQFSADRQLVREGSVPLAISLLASVEGLDNFGEERSPSLTLVLSKRLGERGALYLEPSWVGNTRVNPSAPGTDDSTLVVGLGARLRVVRTIALVGEIHPRLAGYRGDLGSGDPAALASFGFEWRVGGHAFQLSFSNAHGTTPAQVARGQQGVRDWFIGFNLTRKFY